MIRKKILDEISPYVPGKPIEEVKRELGLKEVIKLASNENGMRPSRRVIEAITEAAGDVNRYPDGGCFRLREAVSEKFSVSPDNIVFGNGSDEIIFLALRAFLNPGDEVVIAEPTFLVYRSASLIEGAKVRTVPLKNFKYDLGAMAEAVTPKTKIVFIANPDNPTGTYVNDQALEAFIGKLPANALVFLDEAYYEFAKGEDYPESLPLIKRKDVNVIVTRTFSKAYSLAGLRIGYAFARKDIADALNKVREPFNVNSLAQVAALAALKDEKYLRDSLGLVEKEKKRFYEVFDKLDVAYVPSRTNFVLVDTGRSSQKVFEYMLGRGVIIREMTAWGLKQCIRVNIGLRDENEMFFKVFTDAMREIPKEEA